MNDEIMEIVNEATDYAENAPYADPEDALKHVYAEVGGNEMAVISYIDAITLAMREEMERDEKCICFRRRCWDKKVACLKLLMVYMNNLVKNV